MRIACVQFAPQVGDVDNNLNRADSVLSKADPQDLENLDLLVLPEMAFSGYNFESLSQITPFLEHAGSGISSLWARTNALKYDCTVVVGYPEKVDVGDRWPSSPEYYNSAIMVSSEGETLANYRKSHLYYTDDRWALEGEDGFFTGYVPGIGYAAMGICMDLNPYKFEAPWHAYEFAFHVLDVEANVVILTMAWLTNEEPGAFSRQPQEPDVETLTYWVQRLEPLIRAEQDDEIIVIFCNRTGIEGDAVYAGTSAVMGIYHGEVNLYGILGRGVKEVLVVDTANKPKAQLKNASGGQPIGDLPMRRMLSPIDSNTITEASPGNETSPAQGNQTDPNAAAPHSAAPGGWSALSGTPGNETATPSSSGSSKSQRVKPPSIRIPVATRMWQELPKEVIKEDQEESHTPTGPSPVPMDLRPDDAGSTKPSEWLWTPSSAHPSRSLKLRSPPPASGSFRGRTKSTFGLVTPDTPSRHPLSSQPLSSANSTSSARIWQELAEALCTPPSETFVPGVTDTPGILDGIMDSAGMNFPAPFSAKSTTAILTRSRTSSRTRSASITNNSSNHPPKTSGLVRTKDYATGIEHASPIARPISTDPNGPRRPSSPKSRNVSRSRPGRRSDSIAPVIKKSGSMTSLQRLDALISRAEASVEGANPPNHKHEKQEKKEHRRHRSQETTHRRRKEDFSYPHSAFPRSDAPAFPFSHASPKEDTRTNSPGDLLGSFIPLIASPSIFTTTDVSSPGTRSQVSLSARSHQPSHRSASHRSDSSKSESRRSEKSQKLRAEGQLAAERLAAYGLGIPDTGSRADRRDSQEQDVKLPSGIDKLRHRRDRSLSVAETVRATPRDQNLPLLFRPGSSLLKENEGRSKSVIRAPDQDALAYSHPTERPASASSNRRAVSRGRQRGIHHTSPAEQMNHQESSRQEQAIAKQQQQQQQQSSLRDNDAQRRRRHKQRSASMGEDSSGKAPDLALPSGQRSLSRSSQPRQLTSSNPDDIIATVDRVSSGCRRHGRKRAHSGTVNIPRSSSRNNNSDAGDVVNVTLRVQLPAGLVQPGANMAAPIMARQDSGVGGKSMSGKRSSSRRGSEDKMSAFNPPTPKALEHFSFSMPTRTSRDVEISCEISRPVGSVMA